MLRFSMPLISVQDLPAAIKSRSRFSSSGVQRTLGITQSFLHLQPDLDQAADGFGTRHLNVLHGYPGVNRSDMLTVHTDDLRLTGTRRLLSVRRMSR
jgi:hypothetical protein